MESVRIVVLFFFVLQNVINARELDAGDRYQIGLTCIEQTGVQRSAVEEAIAGNIPKYDDKYKDFLACSYKKQGFQSETGEILIENVKKFLQKYHSSDLKALNVCSGYNEKTHGENAYNALQCIMGELKKLKDE